PLEIIPTEIILSVYRCKAVSNNSDSNDFRGTPIHKIDDLIWDESACGSKLIIEDNGKVIHAQNNCSSQSVKAKRIFDDKSVFEWDVIIEKTCQYTFFGVCASSLNYEIAASSQCNGWVLC